MLVRRILWRCNGDHPHDNSKLMTNDDELYLSEGDVVRRYRNPDVSGDRVCEKCGKTMHNHGWIENYKKMIFNQTVCPGTYVPVIYIEDNEQPYLHHEREVFCKTKNEFTRSNVISLVAKLEMIMKKIDIVEDVILKDNEEKGSLDVEVKFKMDAPKEKIDELKQKVRLEQRDYTFFDMVYIEYRSIFHVDDFEMQKDEVKHIKLQLGQRKGSGYTYTIMKRYDGKGKTDEMILPEDHEKGENDEYYVERERLYIGQQEIFFDISHFDFSRCHKLRFRYYGLNNRDEERERGGEIEHENNEGITIDKEKKKVYIDLDKIGKTDKYFALYCEILYEH